MVPSSIYSFLCSLCLRRYSLIPNLISFSGLIVVLMVKMIIIKVSPIYVRAYVLVDDSDDEQATAPHETGTGELRTLSFLS
jgi:hypothetical protein